MIDAQIGKGEILIRLKRFEEALTVFNHMLTQYPKFLPAIFLLGVTYIELADHNQDTTKYRNALECLNKAIGIDPNHIHSLANIIYVMGRLGNLESFETGFKKLAETYPDQRGIIYQYLAVSLHKLNHPKSVRDILGDLK